MQSERNTRAELDAKVGAYLAAGAREVVQGPDGNLYVATDAGEIWRVVPN